MAMFVNAIPATLIIQFLCALNAIIHVLNAVGPMKIIALNAILLLLEKLSLLKHVCANKDIMIMAVRKNVKNAIQLGNLYYITKFKKF